MNSTFAGRLFQCAIKITWGSQLTPFTVGSMTEAKIITLGRSKFESELQGVHYGTDGSKLARAGIQTVVCGPGDIADAHNKDEHIEIEQVELATRLYTRLLSNLSRNL